MTKAEKGKYENTDRLRYILRKTLNGKKFQLDCGHLVTFGQYLGNDITIYNGNEFKIICTQCGY